MPRYNERTRLGPLSVPKTPSFPFRRKEGSRSFTQAISQLIEAGTEGYDKKTRRRLMIVNVAAYLIVLASLNYAVLYSVTDFFKYQIVVYANIFLMVVALLVPYTHRFSDIAGGVIVAIAEFIMMFYLISVLGRDSGIQINYIIAAAIPFLIFDLKRIWLILSMVTFALVFHLAAWFLFPADMAAQIAEPFLLTNVYVTSAITTFCIVAIVAYYAMTLVSTAEAQTDTLLRNVLPESVAERLMQAPDRSIADSFPSATVLFADLVGFTPMSKNLGAEETVRLLNNIFSEIDNLATQYDLEKIKTIGDAYMVAAGIPQPDPDHVRKMGAFSLELLEKVQEISSAYDGTLNVRVGIDTGPVTAGVIGRRKFSYDVWGDTVNLASRMESHGSVGKVHVSSAFKSAADQHFHFTERGLIDVKGIGEVTTWYLEDKRPL